MKKSIRIFAQSVMLAATIFLQACDDDSESKNVTPMASTTLKIKAVTNESSFGNERTEATGLIFKEAFLGVTEIEFETLEEENIEDEGGFEDLDQDGEADDEEIEFEGTFVIDLIDESSEPEIDIAELSPAIYDEIEFEVMPVLSDDKTMIVTFEYLPDGATEATMVEYSNNFELEIELEAGKGFNLKQDYLNKLLVIINLDELFADMNLENAEVDDDDIIRINNSSNASIALAIANNFQGAIHSGKDDNNDGQIDVE
ncbi:hypothetical protein [Fulvivirga sp.]|uniref:hypothetical protein n=1 Tax=Fulvivirga sp. TaxID=1931237 RepID=UPI0032EFA54C